MVRWYGLIPFKKNVLRTKKNKDLEKSLTNNEERNHKKIALFMLCKNIF